MTVLDDIIAGVREDMAHRQATTTLDDLAERVANIEPARTPLLHCPGELRIISEVKRSSPSKGHLADIPEPAELARAYEAGGAAAISVLTEERRFKGSLADLDAVRAAVKAPLLRKDFTIDPYQIWEARAHGADLILLIVAALDDDKLAAMLNLTEELGMTALVETHTAEEISRALDAGASVVGVNARNLKTLDVDLAVFDELAPLIPDDVITVAESGVSSIADALRYYHAGADTVLMGEVLVKTGNPTQMLDDMITASRKEDA